MIARTHYDRRQLEGFLNDDSGASSSGIAAHLESCLSCQEVLESLAQSDFDWRATAELLSDDSGTPNKHGCDDEYYSELTSRLLEPSQKPSSIGRFGRYEIIRFIGRGGMGIVMEGIDSALDRRCAIKILSPELASSAAARRRFFREAKSAAAVVHAHVVPIQTVDEFKGMPYLVMPVVDGQSLQRRVERHGPLSILETVRIAAQVAAGLAAAHAQGLVHRDIKPANILLENGVERVQLTDFGLARATDDANMTRSGVIAGTPQYMSPEQAHGDDIDYRSDLFSLGCTMYFMLTGRSPFRAETTMGVLNRIINDPPRPLHAINPDVPQWLSAIVMMLLEKNREDRFQTAEETSQLLERWLAHLQSPGSVKAPDCSELQKYFLDGQLSASNHGNKTILRWIAGLGLGGFALWLGTMIVLETNKGTLRIESNSDTNVPIRILQDGETVEQLTVSKEGTTTRLQAGQYTIELGDGVSGYEIDNDRVTLLRGKDWIAKVELSKANNSAAAQNLLNDRYMRIPVEGAKTSEGTIQAIDPPSDAQVLAALKDELKMRGEDATWIPPDIPAVRIVKEKIVDFVDPIRTIPLLGETQLHHAHYKCTLYFDDPKVAEKSPEDARVEVVFIDHYHMHVADAKFLLQSKDVHVAKDSDLARANTSVDDKHSEREAPITKSNVDVIIRATLEDNPDILRLADSRYKKVDILGTSFILDHRSPEARFELVSSNGDIFDVFIQLACEQADDLFWENIKGKDVKVQITNEDIAEADSGKSVQKVIYLSDQRGDSPPEIQSLSIQRGEPGVDVLAEADRLGQPVLVMRLLVSHAPRTVSILSIFQGTLGRASAEIRTLSREIEQMPAKAENAQQRIENYQVQINERKTLTQRINHFTKRMTGTLGE